MSALYPSALGMAAAPRDLRLPSDIVGSSSVGRLRRCSAAPLGRLPPDPPKRLSTLLSLSEPSESPLPARDQRPPMPAGLPIISAPEGLLPDPDQRPPMLHGACGAPSDGPLPDRGQSPLPQVGLGSLCAAPVAAPDRLHMPLTLARPCLWPAIFGLVYRVGWQSGELRAVLFSVRGGGPRHSLSCQAPGHRRPSLLVGSLRPRGRVSG